MANKNTPLLYLLGTGNCAISTTRGQTSALLINGETTFIFDLGLSTPLKLIELNAFKDCENLVIHLSHKHIDHIGGIFAFLQALTWADDWELLKIQSVTIHCTNEVEQILLGSFKAMEEDQFNLAGYYPERNRALKIISYDNSSDFVYRVNDIEITSQHLPNTYNHGIRFKLNEETISITGDATEYNQNYIDFCKGSDIIIFDIGHLSNSYRKEASFELKIDNIVDLLTECKSGRFIATHLTLRHLEHREVSKGEREACYLEMIREIAKVAKQRGFMGSLEIGQDLMLISGKDS